jgi:hypothetical protein
MSDASRHVLRKAVHKLLPQCPAAILIDLSEVSEVPRLVQMTLLSLVVEASQEPATPLGFCTTNPDVAHALTQNGRTMRVFGTVDEARQALTSSAHRTLWIQHPLGSGSDAPRVAARHVAEACDKWQLSAIATPARSVAFHLVSLARGPYELHLTLSLRDEHQLLTNVRNYATTAKTSPQRNIRMALGPGDEARIRASGAAGCGRMITGGGVAWWALIDGRTPA